MSLDIRNNRERDLKEEILKYFFFKCYRRDKSTVCFLSFLYIIFFPVYTTVCFLGFLYIIFFPVYYYFFHVYLILYYITHTLGNIFFKIYFILYKCVFNIFLFLLLFLSTQMCVRVLRLI